VVACEVVNGANGFEVVVMRPSWMGPDPVEERVKALQGEWIRMAEENRAAAEKTARAHAELWAGIEVGDVVTLTVDATVRRGGLMVQTADGDVERKQVKVVEIKGEMANVLTVMGWKQGYVQVSEWVSRGELDEVVKEGLAVVKGRSARQYWD